MSLVQRRTASSVTVCVSLNVGPRSHHSAFLLAIIAAVALFLLFFSFQRKIQV